MKASQVQGTKAAPSRECGWRGRVGGWKPGSEGHGDTGAAGEWKLEK